MRWDYEYFIRQVYKLIEIDLIYYKERQMKRRINSLISRNGFDGYENYYKALLVDNKLLEQFIDYITINVSDFFRNPKQWEVLEHKILPMLYKRYDRLRIWSAACSTGEEPYSLAILLDQYVPLRNIEIIATDVDKGVLDRAKRGIYIKRCLEGVPERFKKKYFQKNNKESTYIIDERIRRSVRFKQHDLLKDSYPINCHLIACRNVMIYFTEEAKKKLYRKFHKSLHTDGVFFVGSTEQIILPQRYDFEPIETFFYKKHMEY